MKAGNKEDPWWDVPTRIWIITAPKREKEIQGEKHLRLKEALSNRSPHGKMRQISDGKLGIITVFPITS